MFFFLFRVLGALVAAAIAGFVVLVIGAVSAPSSPEWAVGTAVVMLIASTVAFVWGFRRLGLWRRPETGEEKRSGFWGRWREKRQIQKLKEQAVRREIGPEATRVARVLGGGSYATPTLRASWDERNRMASVDVAADGAWRTVFAGVYHPEVAGQVVPSTIRPSTLDKDRYSVSTTRVGYERAWWEVVAYIPGEWEEDLHRLWKESKQVEHEQEKDRFGL